MTKKKTETMPELTPEQQERLVKYRPQLLALYSEVEAARMELMGSHGEGISDFEFTQLVQLAYPSDEPNHTDIPQRIEADRAAIKRALAGGQWDFVSRLASLQKGQMRGRADHRSP